MFQFLSEQFHVLLAENDYDYPPSHRPPEMRRFTCFLPRTIMQAIIEGKILNNVVDPAPNKKMMYPVVGSRRAVLVFTDASGFTAMTEKLSKQASGAEELGGFLNVYAVRGGGGRVQFLIDGSSIDGTVPHRRGGHRHAVLLRD